MADQGSGSQRAWQESHSTTVFIILWWFKKRKRWFWKTNSVSPLLRTSLVIKLSSSSSWWRRGSVRETMEDVLQTQTEDLQQKRVWFVNYMCLICELIIERSCMLTLCEVYTQLQFAWGNHRFCKRCHDDTSQSSVFWNRVWTADEDFVLKARVMRWSWLSLNYTRIYSHTLNG